MNYIYELDSQDKEAREGEQSAVVWKLLNLSPFFARRSIFGVSINPPKLPICAKPVSSNKKIIIFGAPSGGRGYSGHHSTESSYFFAIFPLNY